LKDKQVNGDKPKGCPFGFHLLKSGELPKSSDEIEQVPRQSRTFKNLDKVDEEQKSNPELVEAAQAAFANFSPKNGEKEVSKKRNSFSESRHRNSVVGNIRDNESEVSVVSVITDENTSLYEQLGGETKLKLFIDFFLDGIMADAQLACYHEKFRDPEEEALLKFKLYHFFRWKLDGAPHYIGKTMYEAHKNLGITDEIFDKASTIFTTQLRRIKPKMKVFREFVKRVGDMRGEIVIPLESANDHHKAKD
jgi:truncated hemoglobin YjbI